MGGSDDAASRELARRAVSVQEAQELLLKGDEAYGAGKFDEAVAAFAGALEMLPNAPQTAELRSAAADRYAQAAVEQAKILSRKGDMDGAKALMDKVLAESAAPHHAGALAFRAQLDDPIRSNPALDAEHAKDVDEVRRLLYTAQGAYDLGKFDEANQRYEEVLRIDPTNSAARRGMERVAAAKSDHGQATYDQTRAEMLSQIDAEWERPVPAPEDALLPSDGGATLIGTEETSLKSKLDQIIIPSIALEQSSLDEALDFLRLKATENDKVELDPSRRGVNFTVNLGAPDSEASKRIRSLRFDLRLSQVPLSKALRYLTEMTQTAYKTDEFSVIITPAGFSSDDLVLRSYRVPPDFLTGLNNVTGSETAAADPFGEAPAQSGLLTSRLSAQEALAKQGVTFPEGASAHYSPATNILRIVNTEANQETIAQIIDAMSQSEPVAVAVKVTMIRTQQTNLEELGFDWLLSGAGNIDNSGIAAGGGTLGNGTARTAADFTGEDIGDPQGIMTAGLRSGDGAVGNSSIDDLLASGNTSAQVVNVAPGVLSVTGVFGDAQFKSIMRGLDQKKGVDIMARPSVVTRSGQASNIAIIREFMYPSEYEPPEVPQDTDGGGSNSPVTPATPSSFKSREVGITLEVLPVADANKRFVDVTLNPSFVEFDGFVNFGSPIRQSVQQSLLGAQPAEITKNAILMPIFSVQRLATQLTVADGATIAIGGLMTESVKSVDDKVPVLGDIPVVGRMFSSRTRESVSTAVIFLVNIELIDPTGRAYRDR
ncbi:MAG: Amuc_1098 family type IV pilus outer membrane protein [Luteolibacter sp.]